MKYVRTKDGRIIGFEPKTKDLDLIKYLSQFANYQGEYAPIKQANTIEELCDEAVFFDEDNVPHYKSKEGNVWYLGAGLFTESLRFGIFTDKGLIYVAKMNDKGDLELLWKI